MQDLDQVGMEMLQVEGCVQVYDTFTIEFGTQNSWRRVELPERNYKRTARMHAL